MKNNHSIQTQKEQASSNRTNNCLKHGGNDTTRGCGL